MADLGAVERGYVQPSTRLAVGRQPSRTALAAVRALVNKILWFWLNASPPLVALYMGLPPERHALAALRGQEGGRERSDDLGDDRECGPGAVTQLRLRCSW